MLKKWKKINGITSKKYQRKLIKFKNELIRKNRINNKIKKDLDDYKGIKDIRYSMVLMILNICLMELKTKNQ